MIDSTQGLQKILVVDDSSSLLEGLRAALEGNGFEVFTAASGEIALELMAESGLPHLALVDINMPPGMDGLEFCRRVHEFSDLPVVMLTAVGEEDTIVQTIEHYAEDYVIKPFNLDELLVRVRRVLRSKVGSFALPLEPSVRVDQHLTVNFAKCEATMDGSVVSLTPTETKLLYIFVRSAGQTLSESFILRRLWPLENRSGGSLRVYLHRIRQKLETEDLGHSYVVSQRATGYSFIPCSST